LILPGLVLNGWRLLVVVTAPYRVGGRGACRARTTTVLRWRHLIHDRLLVLPAQSPRQADAVFRWWL